MQRSGSMVRRLQARGPDLQASEARPVGALTRPPRLVVPEEQMGHRETVLILDFGAQYTQLIARRVREQRVYCEIHPHNIPFEQIRAMAPRAIILSGGPASVYGDGAPSVDPRVFELGVPVLGICYGLQLIAHLLGGKVEQAHAREY